MQRLILAGGGHAHLHVLKALATKPWPGVEVTLISPYARQIYSGMVPGWMAGHYTLEQCAAPLEPLVRAAGMRFVQDALSALHADQKRLETRQSGDFAYDLLSLDTGALVDSSELAASSAALLPIRPLEDFVLRWSHLLETARARGSAALAVVGGGAAGVELALAARYRLVRELGAARVEVSLIAGSGLLPGHGPRVVARVSRCLAEHRVAVLHGRATGCPGGLQLEDGRRLAADGVIAATGVQPAPWLAKSGLTLAGDGFIGVMAGQQSASHPQVFAAGDVATRLDTPHAKSGVYAVRAGPVLANNLQRQLAGLPPLPYQPQQRSLYLLATGPRVAIMSWGGLVASGAWAWHWKDWIDRRFMRQYELNQAPSP